MVVNHPTAWQAASKIVCTLGPACRDVETLMKLINAGMTAARVDLTVRHPPALPNVTLDMLAPCQDAV